MAIYAYLNDGSIVKLKDDDDVPQHEFPKGMVFDCVMDNPDGSPGFTVSMIEFNSWKKKKQGKAMISRMWKLS